MKAKHFSVLAILILSGSLMLTSCYQHDNYNNGPYNGNNNYNHGNNNNNNTGAFTYTFDEEFNGADHYGWNFTDPTDSAYGTITNGSYEYVDYSTLLSSMVVVNTGSNTSSNFTVTARIKSNKIMGLIFGASTSDNGYAFYVDTAGNYSLYKEGTGTATSTVIIPSTQDTLYAVKNNWNTLELDQINNTWTGYINGTQIFNIASQSLSGSQFGFKVLQGTTGFADYIVVKSY